MLGGGTGTHTRDSLQWTDVTWKTASWPGSSIHRAQHPERGEVSRQQRGMGRWVTDFLEKKMSGKGSQG